MMVMIVMMASKRVSGSEGNVYDWVGVGFVIGSASTPFFFFTFLFLVLRPIPEFGGKRAKKVIKKKSKSKEKGEKGEKEKKKMVWIKILLVFSSTREKERERECECACECEK